MRNEGQGTLPIRSVITWNHAGHQPEKAEQVKQNLQIPKKTPALGRLRQGEDLQCKANLEYMLRSHTNLKQ